MKLLNVLIVDDHPLIAQSFTLALKNIENNSKGLKFTIKEVTTLDSAYSELSGEHDIIFDLIFLDIKLPPSKDKDLLSGEDLGVEIRRLSPESKIIIATTYNDNFRLNNLFKSINPEGLLVKNDLKPDILVNAINDVLEGIPAYTKTVKLLLKKLVSSDVSLDQIDRKILYHLSIGARMFELPNRLLMSIGGIEKRKRSLKEAFGVTGKDDKALIKIAKAKGFI